MSSAAQINANRHNAQSSTGPHTEAGKSRASQNSFQHGLASNRLMIPGEDHTQYQALLAGLFHDHNPQGTFECLLVDRMALSHWLMLRAVRLQAAILNNPETAALNTNHLTRYQVSNERMFWKAFDTLRKLQKERAELEETEAPTENGFVPQPVPTSKPTPAETAPPTPTEPHPMWQKRPNPNPLPPTPKRKRF